jgi:hypothetical protein
VAGLRFLQQQTVQLSSPDTAAGPPRIQTVFRFVEPNGRRIFPERFQRVKSKPARILAQAA